MLTPMGGGGGGGGRIAVYYDDISGYNTANITAYGATGLTANGGAGTIYLKSSAQSYGDLIVDNNNIATMVYSTPLPSVGTGTSTGLSVDALTDDTRTWRANDLVGIYLNPNTNQNTLFKILSNDDTTVTTDINDGDITAVAVAGNSYGGIHVFDNLYIRGSARIETADGIKAVNPTDTINNIFEIDGMLKAYSLDAGGSELVISSGGIMTDIINQGAVNAITLTDSTMESGNRFVLNTLVLNNSTLTVYNDLDATTLAVDNGSELSVAGVIASDSISIANNSRLNHPAATTTGEYRLTVNTNTLSIDSGSVIDVSARGYLGGYQDDNLSEFGRTIGNTNTGASRSYSGASYGGLGGEYSGYTPNAVYGSLYNPDDLGSGGGSSGSVSYRGGNGGGLTRITCGTLNLNGNIRADRGTGGSWYNGGGIYLQAGTLTGGGAISANGGAGGNPGGGGGGGGGRIAVYYDDISGYNTANITAYGATGLTANGGAGTIYLKSSAQSYGDLMVDNNNTVTIVYSTPLPSVGSSTSTGLSVDTLMDSGAAWRASDLYGTYLNPDVNQTTVFLINANDATTITVDNSTNNLTDIAVAGDTYLA